MDNCKTNLYTDTQQGVEMKSRYSKNINTPLGSFIWGYSLKAFGLGFRIDVWGVTLDIAWFWFAWEK